MTITTAPETFAPLHDIIEPKWWTGTPAIPPELFTIDGNDFRIPGEPLVPSPELAECMQKTFDDYWPGACDQYRVERHAGHASYRDSGAQERTSV